MCDAIIALVKKHSGKYLSFLHKFGVECPKTVEDALELDKCNDNTMWVNTIAKEMKNIQVAFDPLEASVQLPNGYLFAHCHMIFNVKIRLPLEGTASCWRTHGRCATYSYICQCNKRM